MRSEFLQLLFYAIALVVGGASEEVLPKAFGVGVPVLMTFAVFVADRKSVPTMILFALTAGAFEDALSSLPMMVSPCFFLVTALLVRRTHFVKSVLVVAYPLYQIWLKLLVPGLAGSLGTRFPTAFLIAVFMAFAAVPLFAWLERKAAVDAG